MIDTKEPNKASVSAFFLSAALTPAPPPDALEAITGGGVEATLPLRTGVALLDATLDAGGGVDGGLEMLSITERSRASAFDALLGFRDTVFSATTELGPGLGLEFCSGGVARAKSGW